MKIIFMIKKTLNSLSFWPHFFSKDLFSSFISKITDSDDKGAV